MTIAARQAEVTNLLTVPSRSAIEHDDDMMIRTRYLVMERLVREAVLAEDTSVGGADLVLRVFDLVAYIHQEVNHERES